MFEDTKMGERFAYVDGTKTPTEFTFEETQYRGFNLHLLACLDEACRNDLLIYCWRLTGIACVEWSVCIEFIIQRI